jgi:hypothetical protein
MFSALNEKYDWKHILNISFNQDCIGELLFWKNIIFKMGPESLLLKYSIYNLFTDASNFAAAGFIENSDLVMHIPWLRSEASKSSVWREIKAIELCLLAFIDILRGSLVTFYTDSQNAASIVLKGSRVPELQVLALSIYNTCRQNNVDLNTVWIPREQNAQADFFSRIIDVDDWQTTTEFFEFLDTCGVHIQ